MKRVALAFVAVLLCAGEVFSQSVKLPATATAKPGRMIRLVADTADPAVSWMACTDDFDLIVFPDGKSAIFCALDPGTYKIAVVTARGDKISEFAYCLVTVVGPPSPPPVPPTPPGPTPPTPTVSKVWAIFVVDNKNRTVPIAKIVNSKSLMEDLTAAGHKYRVFDLHDPTMLENRYAELVTKAGGSNALLILGMDGKVLRAVAMPADEAGVRKIISQVTGK